MHAHLTGPRHILVALTGTYKGPPCGWWTPLGEKGGAIGGGCAEGGEEEAGSELHHFLANRVSDVVSDSDLDFQICLKLKQLGQASSSVQWRLETKSRAGLSDPH